MSEQNPDFKQPPWVYGPKETMDWIEATHPSKKSDKKSRKKNGNKILVDPHIHLDLNVEQTKINPQNVFSRLLSKIIWNTVIEEHFDLLSTSEIILRGLAKVKFHHNIKILIDKKIKYDNPKIISDIKKSIDIFKGISTNSSRYKILEITAVLDDIYRCIVEIKIKKVHRRKEHTIDIFMKGIIKEELYHTFLNYLNDKLKIKNK